MKPTCASPRPDRDQPALRAHILCRVVDNYGDAGVCWRLACQLVAQAGWQVRLTIDRPELLARFGARPDAGVRIESWPAEAVGATDASGAGSAGGLDAAESGSPRPDVARSDAFGGDPDDDVLISAFGCEPPPALRASLAGGARRPLWIHLEYLSAESWVDGCHGLRSVRPADGAIEHFFYPGFGERTGGLLRERDLLARRDAFVGSPEQRQWLTRLGIELAAQERLVTLFCYPEAPLGRWFALAAAGAQPLRVLVPETVAEAAIAAAFGTVPRTGQPVQHGRLCLQRIPFLDHDDYDRLLWSADLNFVRGEDSWIRAHWAARPFIWQPYVQRDDAHLVKLDAFLARLDAGPLAAAAMRAWSNAGDLDAAWPAFAEQLDALAPAYRAWSARLAAQTDLVTHLVEFCRDRL